MLAANKIAPSTVADDRPHVVVLGAGVCGLYAARVLVDAGVRITLLDRFEVPGGLAAGRERHGNYYDFGVHQLHAFDAGIFEDLRAIMGERLISAEKSALIRYGRGFRRYPLEFQDLITGVPPLTLVRAFAGLASQQAINRLHPTTAANAEEALIQLYGRPLYKFFFRDFTHRYWGIPPAELSAAFVRRKMPRLSAVDVVKKALGHLGIKEDPDAAVESAVKEEIVWYSRTGSRELPLALAGFIARRGGEVRLESMVTGLDVVAEPGPASDQNGVGRLWVTGVRYHHGGREHGLTCDAVLSTIPLAALVRAFGQVAPAAVRASAGELRHKAVAIYGYLVRRPRVLAAQHVYYRERLFHRLAEPANSGMIVTPPGHTVVLAEATCDVGDDCWLGGEATRRRMLDDLAAEGLFTADEVVETHLFRDEYAYPVFALGFEQHLAAVEAFLSTVNNLRSTGRQGAFTFPNMHAAMRLGADTARVMLSLLP